MALTGRVAIVTIKDEVSVVNVRRFEKVQLQLTKDRPKLTITLPPDNAVVCEVDLRNCAYVMESSTPGVIDCIRSNAERKTLIIMDSKKESTELLTYMRNYLQNPPPPQVSEHRAPANSENVNRFLLAFNSQNANEAAQIARQLANDRTSVRFGLNVINETGNAPPAPPPEPVVEPLKLQMLIESYLIGECTNERIDIAILPGTTIRDLKQKIENDIGIDGDHQYWYINREHLPDDYRFGTSKPGVNESTVLILYIAKP